MAVMARATCVALCGMSLFVAQSVPTMADDGLLIWNASKGGENAANFQTGITMPVRFDPTVVATTTVAGTDDGAFDPSSMPLAVTASFRLTNARALEYGRLSRVEMRVDARAQSGELKIEERRQWLTGAHYELRGSRVVKMTASTDNAGGVQASQVVELDLDRFSTTLSTRAFYDVHASRPDTSIRVSRSFGDALKVGVSVAKPFDDAHAVFDARYTRSW